MADALMARNERRVGLDRPIALGGMQIGMAHAGRRDLDEYL